MKKHENYPACKLKNRKQFSVFSDNQSVSSDLHHAEKILVTVQN